MFLIIKNETSRKTPETREKAKAKTEVGKTVEEKVAAVEQSEGRDPQRGEEAMIETRELGELRNCNIYMN